MPLIAGFDPWKNPMCTCPAKFSLSPYTGCGHGCLYCYASSYIPNFFAPRQKTDFINRLKKEIKKLPCGAFIAIANSSDPYMPLENSSRLTRQTLELLAPLGVKIMLVTKSALITRDIDIFKNSKNILAAVTLTTLDSKLAAKLEPNASSPGQRLAAMEKLSRVVPVICRLDPLIPFLNDSEAFDLVKKAAERGVKQIITSTYKAKPDNLNRLCLAFPRHSRDWRVLYQKNKNNFGRQIYLEKSRRQELLREVREACKNQKVDFSTCREGFAQWNTKPCDGSWLFSG